MLLRRECVLVLGVLGSRGGRQGLGFDEGPASPGLGHLGNSGHGCVFKSGSKTNSGHTPRLASPYRALGLWGRAERWSQEFLENMEKEAIVSDPQVRGSDPWGQSQPACPVP